MDCSCIYLDVDGEGVDIPPTKKIREARKEHICGECGGLIWPGEKYEHVRGKWNGAFSTQKTCLICREIREAFFCEGWFFTEILRDLREHIYDAHGKISEDCLSEMTKPARDRVCDMIEKYWEGE